MVWVRRACLRKQLLDQQLEGEELATQLEQAKQQQQQLQASLAVQQALVAELRDQV